MRKKLFFILLTLPVINACAQVSEKNYERVIEKDVLKEQVYFLASDEMMGRNTGSEEIKIAAKFIAEYFRETGVKEFPEAPEYLQEVPLKISEPAQKCDLKIRNSLFTNGVELVLLAGKKLVTKAEIVFITANWWDEQSEKENSDVNIEGEIVIAELGADNTTGFGEIMARSEKRRNMVKQMGGIALIEIYDHTAPWNRLAPFLNRSSMELDFSDPSRPAGELTHIWIFIEDQELIEDIKQARIQSAMIHSEGKPVRRFKDQNVVGYIPGSDPELQDEYILLTAHYDHLGAGMRNGRGATPEDTIFNGAGDNAMGTVAVMGAAKGFSVTPAKRPIIFLAVTGEEKGFLGSRYFADNPLVPLDQIIFNLNNDGGGMADTGIVNILGLERTGIADLITSACEMFELSVNADPAFGFLFNASDNVPFARKGIPAMTFSPGFRIFNMEIPEHYHRPSDEAETIDYMYYTKFVRAYTRAARNIANAPYRPTWIEGDEYEQAGRDLYENRNWQP